MMCALQMNVCSPFEIALYLQTWCDCTDFANAQCVYLYAM